PLNPEETGASIDGDETRVCAPSGAPVWFEPRRPVTAFAPIMGGRLSKCRPARSCFAMEPSQRDGWYQPAARNSSEADRQTGKSLQVDRAAKAESITELSGVFKASNVVVVAHYSGLTVAQMQTLRKQMKQAGASVKVAKNRLAKIA